MRADRGAALKPLALMAARWGETAAYREVLLPLASSGPEHPAFNLVAAVLGGISRGDPAGAARFSSGLSLFLRGAATAEACLLAGGGRDAGPRAMMTFMGAFALQSASWHVLYPAGKAGAHACDLVTAQWARYSRGLALVSSLGAGGAARLRPARRRALVLDGACACALRLASLAPALPQSLRGAYLRWAETAALFSAGELLSGTLPRFSFFKPAAAAAIETAAAAGAPAWRSL